MRGAGHTVENAGGVPRLALAAGRCGRGAATEAKVRAGAGRRKLAAVADGGGDSPSSARWDLSRLPGSASI